MLQPTEAVIAVRNTAKIHHALNTREALYHVTITIHHGINGHDARNSFWCCLVIRSVWGMCGDFRIFATRMGEVKDLSVSKSRADLDIKYIITRKELFYFIRFFSNWSTTHYRFCIIQLTLESSMLKMRQLEVRENIRGIKAKNPKKIICAQLTRFHLKTNRKLALVGGYLVVKSNISITISL